jgi:hypothetical protein
VNAAGRLDAIITSAPSNSTAAKVMARGVSYAPPVKHLTQAHSENCPPLKPVASMRATAPAVVAELVGREFGRLRVLGVLDDPNRSQKSPAAWVVRCLCGRFETRSRRALLQGNCNGEDRCSACWSLAKIKRAYTELGPRPVEDFTARADQP